MTPLLGIFLRKLLHVYTRGHVQERSKQAGLCKKKKKKHLYYTSCLFCWLVGDIKNIEPTVSGFSALADISRSHWLLRLVIFQCTSGRHQEEGHREAEPCSLACIRRSFTSFVLFFFSFFYYFGNKSKYKNLESNIFSPIPELGPDPIIQPFLHASCV